MNTDRLSQTFAALADPTRRAILARLSGGETSVSDLAKPFDMSLPAISKHLKVLERAGLIARSREAQWRPCRIEAGPLKSAVDWLEHYRRFWEASFDRLDDYLKEIQKEVGITFIYVTHDQEEALTMSDRLAVFSLGQIEQVGTPADVYEHPTTAFVAGFVGTSNLLKDEAARVGGRSPHGHVAGVGVAADVEPVAGERRAVGPRVEEPASVEDAVGQDLVLAFDLRMGVQEVHQETASRASRAEDHKPKRGPSIRPAPRPLVDRELSGHAPDRDERSEVAKAVEKVAHEAGEG